MKLVEVFKDTLRICGEGKYKSGLEEIDIGDGVKFSVENTRLSEPNFMEAIESLSLNREDSELVISVTKESTVEAGIRLWKEANRENFNILALNFASGLSIGGGVLAGARAQEEDLCRSSGLYSCLESVYAK